jgi:hypothetical protein
MQIGLVFPSILGFFHLRTARRWAIWIAGGVLASESLSLALTGYALIAVISGPVPKMFMTRVRL